MFRVAAQPVKIGQRFHAIRLSDLALPVKLILKGLPDMDEGAREPGSSLSDSCLTPH